MADGPWTAYQQQVPPLPAGFKLDAPPAAAQPAWKSAPVVADAPAPTKPAWQSAPEVNIPPLPPGYTLDGPWRKYQRAPQPSLARRAGAALAAPVEAAASMATGALAPAAAALQNLFQRRTSPADYSRARAQWQYTPSNPQARQDIAAVTAIPSAVISPAVNWLAGHVQKATGGRVSAQEASDAVNTALMALPLKGAGRAAGAADTAGVEAAARARDYATRQGLDWTKLPDTFKRTLTVVAGKAGNLDKLDPAAVARQARLQSMPVPVPATRGQLTRDPVQLRNEGNVAATEAGRPVRQTYVAQNKALLQNLDVLKGKVRGTGTTRSLAETPEQVGESVQDKALRAKLKTKQTDVKALYRRADTAGETAQQVSVQPIKDLIAQTPDKTHYGWVSSWMRDMGKGGLQLRALPIKTLEDLRQAAVARAMNGGTEGYYAGKLIDTIDQTTAGKGGNLYKAARAGRKALANEFEEQGSVAKLVENKSRTDRATALEDTWKKTVLGGSIDDLRNVKRSLLTGGTETTRTAGRTAWRDIRAQTIQHIKDEASKSVTRFEDGTPNVTPAAMQRAVSSIGQAKLDEIFGPGTTRQINDIMEATRDVKTEPPEAPSGAKGSSTMRNVLAFLEGSLKPVPIVGHLASMGKKALTESRDVRRALGSPLGQAPANTLRTIGRGRAATQAVGQTLQGLRRHVVAPAAALSLANQGQQ